MNQVSTIKEGLWSEKPIMPLVISIEMSEKQVIEQPEQSTNVEFYLLLIAVKLGFISATKILKGIAYNWHVDNMKRKYSTPDVEANRSQNN